MTQNFNLSDTFDYLLCMDHNVVVELGSEAVHMNLFGNNNNYNCQFLGQNFSISKPTRKLSNDVSVRLVRGINEKKNILAYEKKYEQKLLKRRREQENYGRQIPAGDGILNLEMAEL